jgi:CopG family transcriptional regulator, nickel-responsive regulator
VARGVVRLGISLEPDLLKALDRWVQERNSPSRSEAVRYLVRKELAEKVLADPQADVVGVVTLLYRHDAPMVQRRLTAAQHLWGSHIHSSTHLHLRGAACVEVLLLVGRRGEVERAAEDIRGVKGVLQARFSLMTPEMARGETGHRHPHAS